MGYRINGTFIGDDDNLARALARLFADMFSAEQAEFFDELALQTGGWPNSAGFQWRNMQAYLTPRAKEIINEIKDHTDPSDD